MLIPALILGVSGSLHCLGMCGPLVLAMHFPGRNPLEKLLYGTTYNLGRVLTYVLMGLLLGSLSGVLSVFGVQRYFSIGMGVLILLFLLFPAVSQRISLLKNLYARWIFPLQNGIRTYMSKKTLVSTWVVGIMNGFLPCGLVGLALAGAVASGGWAEGGVFMLSFGLGTIPMMLALVFTQNLVPIPFRIKLQKIVPIVMGVFAVLLIVRGMNLGIPYLSPQLGESNGTVTSACCHK